MTNQRIAVLFYTIISCMFAISCQQSGTGEDEPQRWLAGMNENYGENIIGYKNAANGQEESGYASGTPSTLRSGSAGMSGGYAMDPMSTASPIQAAPTPTSPGMDQMAAPPAESDVSPIMVLDAGIAVDSASADVIQVDAGGSDASTGTDADVVADAEAGTDAEVVADAEAGADAEVVPDAEAGTDAEVVADAEAGTDAGVVSDAEAGTDAEVVADAEAGTEAGTDAEVVPDAETGSDAYVATDAGTIVTPVPEPQDIVEPVTPAPIDEDRVVENPYFKTIEDPISTFSIDVDTGSYTLSRGYINAGELPPAESVRVEEFINYFHFHYQQPESDIPFSLYSEMGTCPWNLEHDLVMVGIQGQEVELKDQPAANLVFLLDVSGSMSDANKLPLLKRAFRMLVRQLRDQDRVSIVTYAGHESVALESTPGTDKATILSAIDRLESGGSTNGAGGIQKAYEIAMQNFIPGGNNRVLLATDGDFNVGISDTEGLVNFIAQKRDTGVFLSVYGFGDAWNGGNYQDEKMEQLADNGNGIYFYIDGPQEARRAFIHTISGSLLTIAKDVKVQVEFNPEQVKAYRLIGYENRMLADADFSNDSVDAGELGAGLSVTALFEIIPASSSEEVPVPLPGTIPEIEESGNGETPSNATADYEFAPVTGTSTMEIRIRYKDPDAQQSQLIVANASPAMRRDVPSLKFSFAAAVSEFAMRLRNSQYTNMREINALLDQVQPVKQIDAEGAVAEFYEMMMSYTGIGQ